MTVAARNRRRKIPVFYNRLSDVWTNDSNEQFALMPGTREYAFYMQRRQAAIESGKTESDVTSPDRVPSVDSRNKTESIDYAYSIAHRKFRRYMSKDRQNDKIQTIVDKGFGRHVSIFGNIFSKLGLGGVSNQDELYDDGISSEEYAKEVISDYKEDAMAVIRERSDLDTNGDGQTDEEICLPGMRTMMKYM